MRRLQIVLIGLIGILSPSLVDPAHAQDRMAGAFVPGELIIGYKSPQDRDQALNEKSATQEKMRTRSAAPADIDLKKVGESALQVRITFPNAVRDRARAGSPSELSLLQEVANQIKEKDPRVKYAHPNWIMNIDPPRRADPDDARVKLQSYDGGGAEQLTPSTGGPNDPLYVLQWHYLPLPSGTHAGGMNAVGAWKVTHGSRDIVVAVLDGGIVDSHEDITGSGNVLPGYNFVTYNVCTGKTVKPGPGATDHGDSCTPGQPSIWHGTHVAGTIGAVGSNNGRGLTGVAWNVRILPIRVLGPGGGSTTDIINAMRWAAGLPVEGLPINKNPADIINMSLGMALRTDEGRLLECTDGVIGIESYIAAIREVRQAGTVVVVAAGNGAELDDSNKYCEQGSTNPTCHYKQADMKNFAPAGCPGVISVAASDAFGHLAPYSNYGAVTIMAPGGDMDQTADFVIGGQRTQKSLGVWSSVKDKTGARDMYGALNGTSQAAPHVSGAIALALSAHPEWRRKPDLIEQKLRAAAVAPPQGGCPRTKPCGPGELDAGILVGAQSAARQ